MQGIHCRERENRKRKTHLTHTGLLMEGARVAVKMNHDKLTKKRPLEKAAFSMHRYVGAYVFIVDP